MISLREETGKSSFFISIIWDTTRHQTIHQKVSLQHILSLSMSDHNFPELWENIYGAYETPIYIVMIVQSDQNNETSMLVSIWNEPFLPSSQFHARLPRFYILPHICSDQVLLLLFLFHVLSSFDTIVSEKFEGISPSVFDLHYLMISNAVYTKES